MVSFEFKYAFNEFLKRAAEIANGDTEKCINVLEIWNDNFPALGHDRDYALPIILKLLKESNFIKDGDNRGQIKLTLNGIYFVVDNLKVPPESLGVLSHKDVKKLENLFLTSLYEQTKGDPVSTVSINEIERRIGGVSGTTRILQIAEYLKMKGLIEIESEDGQIKFKVPSKEVKKYYPPPSPPPRSYSSDSFSSTSFST